MSREYLLDAGVLQGIAQERSPNTPLADRLRQVNARLVTLRAVIAECMHVRDQHLNDLGVLVEPTRTPYGGEVLLDAFSAGPKDVWWRTDLERADRAVVGHAIASRYDILTTDRRMQERSYRECFRRLARLPERQLSG
jgi:hypothetical protein